MADEETTEETEGTETGGIETEEWKPPTKEEWARTQKAVTKANAEAKTNREKLRELQAKSEGDEGKAAREAAEAAEKRFKPVAVRSAAKAAFLEAGLQPGKSIAPLVRMLDLDALDVDDDGDVIGLNEQVAAIKADYPELFTPTEKKPPRLNGADKPGSNGRTLTTGEKIAAQVLGR
jgi:hypothetical protein